MYAPRRLSDAATGNLEDRLGVRQTRALIEGLRELRWFDGRNITGSGRNRTRNNAKELVSLNAQWQIQRLLNCNEIALDAEMGFAPDVTHALPNYGEALGMIKIDDAAILKRAKQLCRNDGVAWDWVSATPRARVLSNRDRRECLMRARDELIGQAIEAGALQDVT